MKPFRRLFQERKPLIGMIHLPPLPDYADSPGIDSIVSSALEDLSTLAKAGFDGVLLENEFDRPHRVKATPATVEAMTTVTRAAVACGSGLAVGCEILLHDPQASMRVARDSGADFIRSDYFVDRMSRPEYGEFEIDPAALIDYRRSIDAEHVAIFADIQVKYAAMLEQRSLTESASLASLHGADAVVVTGDASGDAPVPETVAEAAAGSTVPVLIGSGVDKDNAAALLAAGEGAIVGTTLMRRRRVDRRAAEELIARVRATGQR